MGPIRDLIERLASENVYVSRGLAREDDTIDVNEDDHDRTDDDDTGFEYRDR